MHEPGARQADTIVSQPQRTTTRRGRLLGWLVGIAALAAVVIVATNIAEPRGFVHVIERAEPWWLAVAFALQGITYVTLAQVWRTVARVACASLPLRAAVRIALAKLFVDQTLPSVGISGGMLLATALERRGVARSIVSATIIIDLASYYFAYSACLALALVIAGLAGHIGTAVIAPGFGFVAVGIAIALAAIALSRSTRRLPKWPGLRRMEAWLATADRNLIGNVRLLARATAWQVAIVMLDGATMWTLLRAIGVTAPVAGVFASFMIASLARTVSIVPAGLGVFEGVGVLTLHHLGVPVAAALSAMLLFRGLSYWLPMIPGFIASRGLR